LSSMKCMRGRFFILILVVIFESGSALYASDKNPFIVPERGSASYSGGAFGQTINPVFADLQSTPLLAYQYAFYDGKKSGSHFAQAGLYGFTFLYGYFKDIYQDDRKQIAHAGASYYRFTKGFFIYNLIGIGASYSFSKSEIRGYRGYRGLDLSLLLQPWRYISLGFVMDDAWGEINGDRIKWREVYSLSIRPYTERVTISFDVIRKKGANASKLKYKAAVDVRLWRDISLFGSIDRDLNLLLGISMPLQFGPYVAPGIDLHYYRSNNRKNAPDQNSIGASLSAFKNGNALHIPLSSNYIMITLDGSIPEIEKRSFWGTEPTVFLDILRSVKRAATDPVIDGIILRINKAGIGFAQVQELRNELKNARANGKKVYSVMRIPGNKEYYLAAAADKIYFTPNTTFYLTGLSAQVYFFKGLMEKIGVRFESVKRGAFKSFDESFTRKHMSDAFRENMTSLVKDLNDQYVNDIMADRGLSREAIENLFARGQVTPDEAAKYRFVDSVVYPDEALEDISRGGCVVSAVSYLKERTLDHSWGPRPRISIIYLDGNIVSGGAFNTGWFRSLGDAKYRAMLEKSFSNPFTAAVVVRVNSGGGAANASDYMWNTLIKMKKKYNKPVVFSFGNIAASGGYYVACTGDKIFSDRGTITGSIGVVFGKITLKELYDKLGINKDVIKMSEFADIFSESRLMTDKEKKLLQEGIGFIYDRFTGRVMEGRRISSENISRVAEGRVFSGLQALDKRLTDETGGLITAIEYAKQIVKIDREIEIDKLPDDRGPLLELFKLPDLDFLSEQIGGVIKNLSHIQLGNERALYLFPYQVEIE
jgi:protease IV